MVQGFPIYCQRNDTGSYTAGNCFSPDDKSSLEININDKIKTNTGSFMLPFVDGVICASQYDDCQLLMEIGPDGSATTPALMWKGTSCYN